MLNANFCKRALLLASNGLQPRLFVLKHSLPTLHHTKLLHQDQHRSWVFGFSAFKIEGIGEKRSWLHAVLDVFHTNYITQSVNICCLHNFQVTKLGTSYEKFSRQPKKQETMRKTTLLKQDTILRSLNIMKNLKLSIQSILLSWNLSEGKQSTKDIKRHTLWSPPPVANLRPPGWTSMEKICIPSCLIQLGFSAIILFLIPKPNTCALYFLKIAALQQTRTLFSNLRRTRYVSNNKNPRETTERVS